MEGEVGWGSNNSGNEISYKEERLTERGEAEGGGGAGRLEQEKVTFSGGTKQQH